MKNILLNVYAMCPGKGSEPGGGWNWVRNIAKYHHVFVITESEFKNEIETAIAALPQKDNFTMYYNDIGEKARKMCWNQGDYRFYHYYKKWQEETYKIAQVILAKYDIDLIHQLNMTGYREPGYLWKLNMPMIWGPISGFGLINSSYFKIFPLKTRIKYFAKNIVNSLQAYMPRIQTAIQYPDILIAANSEAKTALQKFRKSGVYLINDTGATNIQFLGDLEKKSKESKFKIAWVGKDVPRKALVLALKAMKEISSADIELHIIGVSEEEYAKYRPLWSDHVINHGIKSHEQTVKLLSQSHMLLFTSLHEGTPHAVLEALSYGVPVVCHDSHGQGDLINESCGIKVALKNPENSVRQFVLAIKKISSDHRYQLKLATGALSHAKDITWEKDIDKVMEMYSLIFNLKRKTVTKKSNLPSHLLQQED